MTAAILLMAGCGARFESPTPKQFCRLSGKRLYLYALQTLLSSCFFQEIILVVHPEFEKIVAEETKGLSHSIKIVPGGTSRQASSFLGIKARSSSIQNVLIHDAVRPFVSVKILEENLSLLKIHRAVDTCIPSYDTLVASQNGALIDDIPNRKHYLRGQTPQAFSLPLILKAHEEALKAGITDASDDCSLVHRLNVPIAIAQGEEENIKITTELDLFLAEQILRLPKKIASLSFNSLEGKKFILTGGTGVIGGAIATLLQEKGATTVAVSRSSLKYPADLSNKSANEEVFSKIFEDVGEVDGLINCVGILEKKTLNLQTLSEIEQLIATNLTSVILACKHVKLKPGAHILNIASSSYSRGRKELAIYSSTKAAIVNFTQGLAEERPDLFINVLAPKRTLSLMREKNFQEDVQELLHPSLIADKVYELLSSQGITGSILSIF